MRRTASLVISISLLLGIVIFVVPVGAERSPFVGSWWSIDVDDSYQRMAIGGVRMSAMLITLMMEQLFAELMNMVFRCIQQEREELQ